MSLKFQSGQEVQAEGLVGKDEKHNIALMRLSSSAPPVEISPVQLTPGIPLQVAAIREETLVSFSLQSLRYIRALQAWKGTSYQAKCLFQ